MFTVFVPPVLSDPSESDIPFVEQNLEKIKKTFPQDFYVDDMPSGISWQSNANDA
jgi:hypothetical protein